MNRISVILFKSFIFPFFFFCLHGNVFAQDTSLSNKAVGKAFVEPDELLIRQHLKEEGMSDAMIDKLFKERAELIASGRRIEWTIGKKLGKDYPVPFAGCGDMGVENGWGSWQGATGTYPWNGSGVLNFNAPGTPAAPRFNLTSGTGVDACTPGGGGPPIPVVAPGFGNASIQLGQPQINGSAGGCSVPTAGCAEQLIYPFTVTAQDTNFVYAYAIVMQNPSHTPFDQPFVSIGIYDANGDSIPCGYFKYIASSALPGFFTSSCFGSLYKPWTLVGINLSAYITQTLTIVITNVDCAQGGHFAHSYWDFSCGVFTTNPSSFCVGQSVTIDAPTDPAIAYNYQWYQNGIPYTGAPSSTAQTITPFPLPGDTFVVEVQQPSGCDFHIMYAPTALSITADFTMANNCGNVAFTDASTSPSAGPITGWNWSFPGGTPASSTNQNEVVTYPPGSYTVTLIATSQSGCKDTMELPLTTGAPTAAFSTGPVCLGAATLFSDSSIASTGDALNLWDWDFGDGSPNSNQQSPSHVYATAGTYSVTLSITTQAGCTNTITQTVTVNPIPLPAFTSNIVCFNTNPTTFTDQSTGATQWNWNFGDGNTSTQQNPTNTYATTGTFTVTLIVTNSFGCKDTLPLTAIVNPLPVALFTSLPVCFGDATTFTDGSTVTPGAITGWSWNFGDPSSGASNTSTLQNPGHIFTGPGQFTVILTATSDSGCQSTTMIPANVNPPPTAAITPQNVCLNSLSNLVDASTFSTGNNINGWDWNFGDGTPNSTQQNPSHTYAASGTYTITLIITTVNGCKDTTTNTVIIYQPPVALFSDSVKGCAPECASMMDLSTSVDGAVSSWQWSFPGGTPPISSVQNPMICWNTPGVFDAQLIVSSTNGCIDTLLKPQYIYVYDWPVADFCVTPTLASINDPQFLFCDLWTSDVTDWMWDFGDGTAQDSISTDPAHNYSASITNNDFYKYTISLAVQNQHGCWDTISHIVEILPEFTFYIPNTFTPNTDGMNELFFGKGRGIKDYEIWLFDRWGNMLWNCDYAGDNTEWDGQGQDGMPSYCKWDGVIVSGGVDMSGNSRQLTQEDVYVWKVSLIDIFDKRHTFVGHVNIVR